MAQLIGVLNCMDIFTVILVSNGEVNVIFNLKWTACNHNFSMKVINLILGLCVNLSVVH